MSHSLSRCWTDLLNRQDPNKVRLRRRGFRRLMKEGLERRLLLATVTDESPLSGSHNNLPSTDVSATYDENINAASATAANFVVRSRQGGTLAASDTTITVAGMTVTLDPNTNFFAGDVVQVTSTSGIQGTSAGVPHVWQFRTAAAGSNNFEDSSQAFEVVTNTNSWGVETGDLDGDGDLDILVGNYGANRVYLNDGSGTFSDSGQGLGNHQTRNLALGDMDGDGDLDAVTANTSGQPNRVWMNNGSGVFTSSTFGTGQSSTDVMLGDLDADGDLDVFISNDGSSNRVFRNDGSGVLSDTGQSISNGTSHGVGMGDLDNDGDLDVLVSNNNQGQRIYLNNGAGVFSDSGQVFLNNRSLGVDLGDLDGDGDLDAYVTAADYTNKILINQTILSGGGAGTPAQFTDSGQSLGDASQGGSGARRTMRVKLGDLDGDGDLDAFVVNNTGWDNLSWVNDGAGIFTESAHADINTNSTDVALGDFDRDGDLDAVVSNYNNFRVDASKTRIWVNKTDTPNVTLSVDAADIVEASGVATVTATLSAAFGSDVIVDFATSGTATATEDYTISQAQIVVAAGSTSGSITITAVQDTLDEADETVVVDITSITNGQGSGQVTTTITDDDEPPMPDVTLTVDNASIPEEAGVATFSVTLSEATTVPVTVDLGISGTAAATDYNTSGTQVVIAAGATAGTVTITAVQDEEDEPDETVIVGITNVSGGNEAGDQLQTTTIVDDDTPPGFRVDSLTPTGSGFRVDFNGELDSSDINLYDTQNASLGAADVVVTGAASGAIAGTLVIGSSSVTFIKSGDVLAADDYTVTLRSAADGFRDTGAMLLDGNGDGTGGDDYVADFIVAETPAGARTVSIPDFVRGPGQRVNLPADETTGIPIAISDGDDVRAADVRIAYDPALLEITGATAPAGGSVIVNTTTTPGVAILVFFSSGSLPAGSSTFINLQATIPASANFGSQQVLDLHAVTIGDGNDNEFPVVVDDAIHFSSYFADVSGNGRVNASDAAQVARFAALIDAGFSASLTTDPIVVGDISGNGRINAADASRVAQFAALIDVPEIPPIPSGVAVSGVVDLGPGLPDLEFPAPTVAPATSQGTGVQLGDETLLAPERPDQYQAVDTVMASMVMLDDDVDPRVVPVLEDAMAELLSAKLVAD